MARLTPQAAFSDCTFHLESHFLLLNRCDLFTKAIELIKLVILAYAGIHTFDLIFYNFKIPYFSFHALMIVDPRIREDDGLDESR